MKQNDRFDENCFIALNHTQDRQLTKLVRCNHDEV